MSLAKYKRDKITEALLDKDYSRHPENFGFEFLWGRLIEEIKEISDEQHTRLGYKTLMCLFEDDLELMDNEQLLKNHYVYIEIDCWEKLKRGLADVSNFVDFIFDRVLILEKKYMELKK